MKSNQSTIKDKITPNKSHTKMELRASVLTRASVLASLPNLSDILNGDIRDKITKQKNGKLLLLAQHDVNNQNKDNKQLNINKPLSRMSVQKIQAKELKESFKLKMKGISKPDHLFIQTLRNTLIKKYQICVTLFESVDCNNDNEISRKEWLDYMINRQNDTQEGNNKNNEYTDGLKKENKKLVIAEFSRIDTDSSLTVDRLEFTMFYMLNNWQEQDSMDDDMESTQLTRKKISFYHILLNGLLDIILPNNDKSSNNKSSDKLSKLNYNNLIKYTNQTCNQYANTIYQYKIKESQFKKYFKDCKKNDPIYLLNLFLDEKMDSRFDKLSLNNYDGASVCEIVIWMMAFDWFPQDIIQIKPEDEKYATGITYQKLFRSAMNIKWKRN